MDHCNPKTDTLAEDYVNYARDFSVGKEKSSWGFFEFFIISEEKLD